MNHKNPDNIREALTQCGFDWDLGRVYLINPDKNAAGMILVQNDNPGLNEKGNYYAIDNNFIYMSCVTNFLGMVGVFPATARKQDVKEIKIDIDAFLGEDPIKGLVKEIISGINVFSVVDATPGKPGNLNLHIVGSIDVPYFVISMSEKDAITIFYNKVALSARQAMASRALEEILFGAMIKKSKADPEGTEN